MDNNTPNHGEDGAATATQPAHDEYPVPGQYVAFEHWQLNHASGQIIDADDVDPQYVAGLMSATDLIGGGHATGADPLGPPPAEEMDEEFSDAGGDEAQ